MNRKDIAREIDFIDSIMQRHFNDYGEETHRALQEAVKLIEQEPNADYRVKTELNGVKTELKQEPCEDEYIKVPKKALKYRTAGMVVYNAEWLKNHFDIERAVICGAQEPCEPVGNPDKLDYIRRQAVLEITAETGALETQARVKALPPVTPKQKTGHWIPIYQGDEVINYRCSECKFGNTFGKKPYEMKYCPNCGAKMSEIPTGSESEGRDADSD